MRNLLKHFVFASIVALVSLAQQASSQTTFPSNGNVSTIAGTGTPGYSGDNGQATNATFHDPLSVAIDSSGNVYVGDNYSYRVRKLTISTGVITTIAGNGTNGFSGDGGLATSAQIGQPFGLALDSSGNLYIASPGDNHVRRVALSTGIITTIAGNGTSGYSGDGGLATNAALNSPFGVAVDNSGNIYIADHNNNRVRKVNASTAIITTVAGNGTGGYSGDGALATGAELKGPYGLAIDSAQNLYIADWLNNRIRKVTASNGIISTIAGNGTSVYSGDGGLATSAGLQGSAAITSDAAGNIFVGDSSRIREIATSSGIISTVAGTGAQGYSGDGGLATAATFSSPGGFAVDAAHRLYLADSGNNRVRVIGATTQVAVACSANPTPYGSGTTCTAAVNGKSPTGTIEWDINSTIWRTDALSGSTDEISGLTAQTPSTYVITALYSGDSSNLSGRGSTSLTISQLAQAITFPQPATPVNNGAPPSTLSASGGASSNPVVFSVISGPGTVNGTTLTYTGGGTVVVAANQAGNTYYAAAPQVTRSVVVAVPLTLPASGYIKTLAGTSTGGYNGDGELASNGELQAPYAVAIDSSSNVYVADNTNRRIRKITSSTGILTTVAGTGTNGYTGDGGPATSANMGQPWGIALDSSGNIYFADIGHNVIRKVTASTGVISTVAGNGTAGYTGDGALATNAELNFPSGVAIDSSGNIFIVDESNCRIRKVTASTGIISTVAGNGTAGYVGDGGLATSAELLYPKGVAVDVSGNVYISDSGNQRVRKVTASSGIITTIAGNGTGGSTGDGGLATNAEIANPGGVSLDSSGNLYIADVSNCRIRRVDVSTGKISTFAGNGTAGFSGDGGAATNAGLYSPQSVAVSSSGYVYISDTVNNRIRVVAP